MWSNLKEEGWKNANKTNDEGHQIINSWTDFQFERGTPKTYIASQALVPQT